MAKYREGYMTEGAYRVYERVRTKGLRAAALMALGGACGACGTEDADVLQITNVTEEAGRIPPRKLYLKIIKGAGEVCKARLLCANCSMKAGCKGGRPRMPYDPSPLGVGDTRWARLTIWAFNKSDGDMERFYDEVEAEARGDEEAVDGEEGLLEWVNGQVSGE